MSSRQFALRIIIYVKCLVWCTPDNQASSKLSQEDSSYLHFYSESRFWHNNSLTHLEFYLYVEAINGHLQLQLCWPTYISDTRYQIIVCIFIDTLKYEACTMTVCQDPVSVPESVCVVDGPGSNYSASCNSDNYDSVQSKLETTITMYYYLLSTISRCTIMFYSMRNMLGQPTKIVLTLTQYTPFSLSSNATYRP